LRRCHRALQARRGIDGRTDGPVGPILRAAAAEAYQRFAESNAVGRALVWELQCESLTAFLEQVVVEDLAELQEGGWEPVLFEVAVEGTLPLGPDRAEERIPVRGRVDRVDWAPGRRTFRVIDYKYKSGSGP